MPEIIEVELYRRALGSLVGNMIVEVESIDARFCRGMRPSALAARLDGARIVGLRRHGKVLLVDLEPGEALACRFGMTGRPFLSGESAVLDLEYGSNRDDPSWDRLRCRLDDGRVWRINDPRCLGSIEEATSVVGRLGADAWLGEVGWDTLWRGCAPIKARLLDQHLIGGLGNMLVDELLWRTGIDPRRPAGQLADVSRSALAASVVPMLDELLARGGSHLGELSAARRVAGGRCPGCSTVLERATVGGRTTYWCPVRQR